MIGPKFAFVLAGQQGRERMYLDVEALRRRKVRVDGDTAQQCESCGRPLAEEAHAARSRKDWPDLPAALACSCGDVFPIHYAGRAPA